MAAEKHNVWEIYKRGQGARTRLSSLIGLGLFVAYGCYELSRLLSAWITGSVSIAMFNVPQSGLIGTGLFVVLALLILYLSNLPAVVDFLIAIEGELRKVSWPGRDDLVRQTVVVLVVVVVFAVVILLFDLVASNGLQRLLPK